MPDVGTFVVPDVTSATRRRPPDPYAAGVPSGSMGDMASTVDTGTGRDDLEPFWPSRQEHHFDRWCCRAIPARTRVSR